MFGHSSTVPPKVCGFPHGQVRCTSECSKSHCPGSADCLDLPMKRYITATNASKVMLFSQGISTAEELAGRIVLLFQLCEEQLSSQSHYDFGLRALKSVLVGAGGLKRKALQEASAAGTRTGKTPGAGDESAGLGDDASVLAPIERDVLIRFVASTALSGISMVPSRGLDA